MSIDSDISDKLSRNLKQKKAHSKAKWAKIGGKFLGKSNKTNQNNL
ncbi:hypothetical protein [Kangiella aquimarina]|uniref:Uncharacterized protein n=1 Tax=Kangiella aquimarina TaxID=261965 RepID=A0ABZ0X0R1_9GAMM|nr:hypothetical protein [Kangiella aquimarina]WQG84173.1 hypothetical protein SR900_06755 [Kangiella aquimarina]